MAVDDFPKNREGPVSHAGRAQAQKLGEYGDEAWLHKYREGDKVLARNSGGKLSVRVKDQESFAIVTFGRAAPNSVYYNWVWTGGGAFSREAQAPQTAAGSTGLLPGITPIGNGRGFNLDDFVPSGFSKLFLEDQLRAYLSPSPVTPLPETNVAARDGNIRWYTTDGYRNTDFLGVLNAAVGYVYIDNSFYYFSSQPSLLNGTTVEGKARVGWVYTYVEPLDHQLTTVYGNTEMDGGSREFSTTTDQLAVVESAMDMGPTNILVGMRVPAFETNTFSAEGYAYMQATAPKVYAAVFPRPSFFMMSRTGGDSWFEADISALWPEEAKTLEMTRELLDSTQFDPPGWPGIDWFQRTRERNDCLLNMRSLGCALGKDTGILLVLSPYRRAYLFRDERMPVPTTVRRLGYMAKVKLAVVDFRTGRITPTRTLFENDDTMFDSQPLDSDTALNKLEEWPHGYQRWHRGIVKVKGGVLLMWQPDKWPLSKTRPLRLEFSADGITWEVIGDTPFNSIATGVITCSREGTLMCPMHDGDGWKLFTSTNMGRTWSFAALITRDIPAFAGNFTVNRETIPLDFVRAVILRRNGQAASATPGSPWASNDQLVAP